MQNFVKTQNKINMKRAGRFLIKNILGEEYLAARDEIKKETFKATMELAREQEQEEIREFLKREYGKARGEYYGE